MRAVVGGFGKPCVGGAGRFLLEKIAFCEGKTQPGTKKNHLPIPLPPPRQRAPRLCHPIPPAEGRGTKFPTSSQTEPPSRMRASVEAVAHLRRARRGGDPRRRRDDGRRLHLLGLALLGRGRRGATWHPSATWHPALLFRGAPGGGASAYRLELWSHLLRPQRSGVGNVSEIIIFK